MLTIKRKNLNFFNGTKQVTMTQDIEKIRIRIRNSYEEELNKQRKTVFFTEKTVKVYKPWKYISKTEKIKAILLYAAMNDLHFLNKNNISDYVYTNIEYITDPGYIKGIVITKKL
jgi:hypothetical protein